MDGQKVKVLILYNHLFHYRIPIFEEIGKYYDLTIAYCYGDDVKNDNFKTIKLTPYKIGPFTLQKENIYRLCNSYRVVIAYGEIAWLKYQLLYLHKWRKFKIAYWTIGVSASYTKSFDSKSKIDFLKRFFYRFGDAKIFYTEYPIQRYLTWGFKREQLFVANNTVAVKDIGISYSRNKILFIGSLYKEKGIDKLLESYKKAYEVDSSIYDLQIVGGGDTDRINAWIEKSGLHGKIKLLGPIYDIDMKAEIFKRSIVAISPNQAGLSVLEAMGYGVPYITSKNAITGGEIFNIQNGKTGVIIDNFTELPKLIIDVTRNSSKYISMGANAYNNYWAYRKPIDMVNGIVDAIKYLCND